MSIARLLLRLLLGRRLPRTAGTLQVPGLKGSLRIHRDCWGIPHIEAEHEADAHFGLGFCQGQDRAFQLEILHRVVHGTLAEIIGPKAVPVDRLSRRIGFIRAARLHWPVLDQEMQGMLEAFARGVSAGVTAGLPSKPHEFVLLRTQSSPWTALDCVALVKLMSFSLPSNWDVELARLKVLLSDGPDALAALDPSYDPNHPVAVPLGCKAGPALDRLGEELLAFKQIVGRGSGSNNWALSTAKTSTGRPLLANDPHLEAKLPAHWYLAQLRTPQWAVAGASFLGGPGILIGHNGFAAWGLTAGLTDNTDLFREEIGPDQASVRVGEEWVPCQVHEEIIKVKGSAPITEKVLVTPRGPIVGPALEGGFEALSLRATWLDPRPLQGLLCAYRARGWSEFRALMSQWPALPQSVVYADTTGTIGYQLIGTAPIRRSGFGIVPAAGWDPEAGWEADSVPFEEMPHLTNPPEGMVASANTQPQPSGTGPFLGVDWIDGYRLSRIIQLLGARSDWNVAAAQQMQIDQQSIPWEEMRPVILGLVSDREPTKLGLKLLGAWDGCLRVDSPAATIYELFVAEMATRLAQARAPRSWRYVLGHQMSVLTPHNFWCFRRTNHLTRLLQSQPAGWFTRSWKDELSDALAEVVTRLRAKHGDDPSGWKWGRLRTLILRHPLGRQGGILGSIFNLGPVPCGGDTDTINQASAMPLYPLAPTENIASLRVVIDVGNWSNSRYVLPGGQSGNPLSPHYGDMFPLWQKGEGVPIAWTEEEVRLATVATLELSSPPQ